MLGRYLRLNRAGVLGLNRRNGDFIYAYNQRRYYPLVDDKVLCKRRLEAQGLAVPALIGEVRSNRQATHLEDILGDTNEFVIKPANGSGGDGIMVIADRKSDYYVDSDGRLVDRDTIGHHLTNVIGGLYSLGGRPDVAMIESLVHFDPAFSRLTWQGVPDIRVIVYRGFPVMAMTRLPTRQSHGKANLHQGAIGVGIDLASGETFGGVSGNSAQSYHPDTGAGIEGFVVPGWDQLMDMSARCYEAVQLGYLGVDLVLDRDLGPLILELNARPGLNIQIANRGGLAARLEAVDRAAGEETPPANERVSWSREQFKKTAPDLEDAGPLDMSAA